MKTISITEVHNRTDQITKRKKNKSAKYKCDQMNFFFFNVKVNKENIE